MYEVFEDLCIKFGVTAYKVAKATGISQTTLSDWKRGRSTPKTDNMKKLADYFGITLDYLMTGCEIEDEKKTSLIPVYERDIAIIFDEIIRKTNDGETDSLYFKGEKIDEISKAILSTALECIMKQIEILRK